MGINIKRAQKGGVIKALVMSPCAYRPQVYVSHTKVSGFFQQANTQLIDSRGDHNTGRACWL